MTTGNLCFCGTVHQRHAIRAGKYFHPDGKRAQKMIAEVTVQGGVDRTRRDRGQDLGCVLFGIDNFNKVNATFGRATADAVLGSVVAACHAEVSYTDVVGHLGDGKFGILLPDKSAGRVGQIAEEFREKIALLHNPLGPFVAASFGVTVLTRTDAGMKDILARAGVPSKAPKRVGKTK